MSSDVTTQNNKEKPSSPSSKGLKEAVAYAGRAWLPVNIAVLDRVKKGLANKEYEYSRQLLVQEIRSDPGLFAFCIRELEKVVSDTDRDKHPVKILKHVDLKALGEILNVSEDKISPHRLERSSDMQILCTKHALISCATTQLLASRTEYDPDVAASFALLRQLGFMLVAWNYPRTFEKALAQLSSNGGDLEGALFKYLGFSPTQLGIKLAADWSRNPGLFYGLGTPAPEGSGELSQEERIAGDEIREFCEIGEALARVNNPEYFPAGRQEWSKVTSLLTDYLGSNAADQVKSAILKAFDGYQQLNPNAFNIEIAPKQSRNTEVLRGIGQKFFDSNSDLKKCPPEIQAKFREVYLDITGSEISIEALNTLVVNVIPGCGFLRGCAYLVDVEGQILIPKLKIGDREISRYKALRSSSTKFSHPVVEALQCQFPIKEENVYMYGDLVSHVTGAFGTRERPGVLYLEMSPALLALDSHVPLVYFRAIRQALNDCLNLRSISA